MTSYINNNNNACSTTCSNPDSGSSYGSDIQTILLWANYYTSLLPWDEFFSSRYTSSRAISLHLTFEALSEPHIEHLLHQPSSTIRLRRDMLLCSERQWAQIRIKEVSDHFFIMTTVRRTTWNPSWTSVPRVDRQTFICCDIPSLISIISSPLTQSIFQHLNNHLIKLYQTFPPPSKLSPPPTP